VQGYGVLTTGWTRSELMAKTIASAKQGNILDPWSYSLLYATDFADRLEHQIIPALRSGFVVLSDRYIYTAFARNVVRGCDRQWIRDVFGFAIVPDLDLVAVLTSTNYNTRGMHGQTDRLLGEYVIAAAE